MGGRQFRESGADASEASERASENIFIAFQGVRGGLHDEDPVENVRRNKQFRDARYSGLDLVGRHFGCLVAIANTLNVDVYSSMIMMVEERYCLESRQGGLKKMSQMAVDSPIGCAGTAQPQSNKACGYDRQHSLCVGVAVLTRVHTKVAIFGQEEQRHVTALFAILRLSACCVCGGCFCTAKLLVTLFLRHPRESGWSRDHRRAAYEVVHDILCIVHR